MIKPRKTIPLAIVIPVYGRQELLGQCIRSIAEQDVWPEEVILIDDGSNPPTTRPDLSLHFPIRILRHQVNQGPAAARNTGMRAATAEWVSFVDSDDRLMPNTLGRRFESVVANRTDRNLVVHGCGWLDITPAGDRLGTRIPHEGAGVDAFASGCWFAPGSCIILNREALNETNVWQDESLRRFEDLDWFLALAEMGWILKVTPLVGTSIERKRIQNPFQNELTAARIIEKWCKRNLCQSAQQRLAAYLDIECASANYFAGNWVRSLRFLLRSLYRVPRTSIHLSPGWR